MTIKISKTHQKFAYRLKDQTALEYPERFLGPNWKNVLNFWFYLDTLSVEDFEIVYDRYWDLDDLSAIKNLAWKAVKDTIEYYNANEAWCATAGIATRCATCELIGSHNLKSLNFLPLFLNL
jgi:hypothetical protein